MKHFATLASVLYFAFCINMLTAHAQKAGFQSFPKYDVAVECNCTLKPGRTMQQTIASAQWGKATTPAYPANAYECMSSSGAEYKLEIEDQRSKYNSMSLADYQATVQTELEELSLRYAKSGSTVRWIRIEGVSGVLVSFYFNNYATYSLQFIKSGLVYRLNVSGDEVNGRKFESNMAAFIKSFKMI